MRQSAPCARPRPGQARTGPAPGAVPGRAGTGAAAAAAVHPRARRGPGRGRSAGRGVGVHLLQPPRRRARRRPRHPRRHPDHRRRPGAGADLGWQRDQGDPGPAGSAGRRARSRRSACAPGQPAGARRPDRDGSSRRRASSWSRSRSRHPSCPPAAWPPATRCWSSRRPAPPGQAASGSGQAALAQDVPAAVYQVSAPDDSGNVVVDLLVAAGQGPAVAQQDSTGQIALIVTAQEAAPMSRHRRWSARAGPRASPPPRWPWPWPGPATVVLAECDPAGGAVLAGLWRGQPRPRGERRAAAVRAAGPQR